MVFEGSLLLKQEPNGLHLRWVVVDEEENYLYWVNVVLFFEFFLFVKK
jgi:hypothetical protein